MNQLHSLSQEIEKQTRLTPSMQLGRKLTTICIGGEIPLFYEPNSLDELATLLQTLYKLGIKAKYLGAGSNLLIPDQGILEPVIRLGKGFRYVTEIGPALFEVGGAMPLMPLCAEFSRSGLSGVEFAAGIPATFGGALRMNAGAHHGEMKNVVRAIIALSPDGQKHELTELRFGYRHVDIPSDYIIIAGKLELRPDNAEAVMAKRNKNLEYRKATQPLALPSSGSVFRNPSPDLAAGALLDSIGMKGEKEGGVEVSTLHANWIVNPLRQGTARQVSILISRCQEKSYKAKNIKLEPEIVRW